MYWTAVKAIVAFGVWRRLTRPIRRSPKRQAINYEVERGALRRLWIEQRQHPQGPPLVAIRWQAGAFNVLGRFTTAEDALRFVPEDVEGIHGPRYWIFDVSNPDPTPGAVHETKAT